MAVVVRVIARAGSKGSLVSGDGARIRWASKTEGASAARRALAAVGVVWHREKLCGGEVRGLAFVQPRPKSAFRRGLGRLGEAGPGSQARAGGPWEWVDTSKERWRGKRSRPGGAKGGKRGPAGSRGDSRYAHRVRVRWGRPRPRRGARRGAARALMASERWEHRTAGDGGSAGAQEHAWRPRECGGGRQRAR